MLKPDIRALNYGEVLTSVTCQEPMLFLSWVTPSIYTNVFEDPHVVDQTCWIISDTLAPLWPPCVFYICSICYYCIFTVYKGVLFMYIDVSFSSQRISFKLQAFQFLWAQLMRPGYVEIFWIDNSITNCIIQFEPWGSTSFRKSNGLFALDTPPCQDR